MNCFRYHDLIQKFSFLSKIDFILSSRVLQDALESLFGKLRFMGGTNKSFGALSFKRILRNYILGCGDVIPQPKNSNISIDEEEEESDSSGFEDCTVDLVEKQDTKGKITVSIVAEAQDEIFDYSEAPTEPIHFEIESDPEFEALFLEQCGMFIFITLN